MKSSSRFARNAKECLEVVRELKALDVSVCFEEQNIDTAEISGELLESIKAGLCEMPFDRQRRYMKDYDLPYSVTSVMSIDRGLSEYFEEAVKTYSKNPKAIANYLINDLLRELGAAASAEASESKSGDGFEDLEGEMTVFGHSSHKERLESCRITPANLAGLVKIIDDGVITKQMAKEVFVEMFATGKTAEAIVEEKGLKQNSDTGELEKFALEAMAANRKAVDQFKAGNDKAINALIGPIMKASKGKANPAMVLDTLKKLIAQG